VKYFPHYKFSSLIFQSFSSSSSLFSCWRRAKKMFHTSIIYLIYSSSFTSSSINSNCDDTSLLNVYPFTWNFHSPKSISNHRSINPCIDDSLFTNYEQFSPFYDFFFKYLCVDENSTWSTSACEKKLRNLITLCEFIFSTFFSSNYFS
jgi:hypothetical protein